MFSKVIHLGVSTIRNILLLSDNPLDDYITIYLLFIAFGY